MSDSEAASVCSAEARMKPDGLARRQLFMPLRAALTGRTSGPELYHVPSILGRDESLRRLEAAACWSQEASDV